MREPHTTASLGIDEHLWRATFAEFRSQALRTFHGNLFDVASGEWVDVGLAATTATTGEVQWPQQQWHIAFEILVRYIVLTYSLNMNSSVFPR